MSTLAGYMFGHFSLLQYLEFLIRILVSCFCGACIGYERTKRLKEAGIRTHIIVCCAASLTMIISKYGFVDMNSATEFFPGTHSTDPARLAAQIISGVSFLGAGIIFRNGSSVRGLTTAAGIWATAAIGLAIGAGMYVIGLLGTLIIAAIQIIMHRFTIGTDSMMVGTISCRTEQPERFRKALDEYVAKNKMQILATKVKFNEDGSETYQFTLRMHVDTTVNDLLQFLESVEHVKAISCEIEK
ncbi:MAG: MgtC/SapB family protein [Clostridia bacterium]|nr:MgtC/SapB family protein [Clostridia bacterium]